MPYCFHRFQFPAHIILVTLCLWLNLVLLEATQLICLFGQVIESSMKLSILCLNADYILNQTVHAFLTCMKKGLNVNGSCNKFMDKAIYLSFILFTLLIKTCG